MLRLVEAGWVSCHQDSGGDKHLSVSARGCAAWGLGRALSWPGKDNGKGHGGLWASGQVAVSGKPAGGQVFKDTRLPAPNPRPVLRGIVWITKGLNLQGGFSNGDSSPHSCSHRLQKSPLGEEREKPENPTSLFHSSVSLTLCDSRNERKMILQ